MSEELKPAPHRDFGHGWAEIERSRFGYWISAGSGPGVYECRWFRFRYRAAKRKAQRIIDKANREQRRIDERERLGWKSNLPHSDVSGGPLKPQVSPKGPSGISASPDGSR